jgi:branched-chain amino acid transport system permease protein
MQTLLAVLIDALTYAAWLFIISAGLTLIYGVMRILNMAHGSLYALGAYAAASFVGYWTTHGYFPLGVFAALIAAGVVVGLIMGPLIERGLLRLMYGKDEIVLLLVTYALFLMLEDVIKLIWGVETLNAPQPYALLGNVSVAGLSYPVYNFLVIALAVAVGVAATWVLARTRHGKLLKAVIHDREMSRALGINVDRYYLVTFTIGAILAAIGGAFTAPQISVSLGIGVEVIVLAFAVVVIGGLGSLPGAALGALIVGLARSLAVHYWPAVELFSVYLVMALVLLLRPQGLFAAPEARKI